MSASAVRLVFSNKKNTLGGAKFELYGRCEALFSGAAATGAAADVGSAFRRVSGDGGGSDVFYVNETGAVSGDGDIVLLDVPLDDDVARYVPLRLVT